MANYDYRCKSCGEVKLVTAGIMNIPPVVYCDSCGGETVRLIAPVPTHYLVGGFYSTDYKEKKVDGNK